MNADAVELGLRRAVELGEIGVQVAAYHGTELIVDSWIGHADGARTRHVDSDTLFPVFSVSKAVTATALHLQVERGLVDYDTPIASYWPEYAARGKEAVTVGHVLSHRAGVPQMPANVTPEDMLDWDWMIERLAEVEPAFPPGTRNTYLSMTFGWLLGEVVRRTDPQQRAFRDFVREEVCAPLKMDAFWFGVPAGEEAHLATVTFPGRPGPPEEGSLLALAAPRQVSLGPDVFNRLDVLRACLPAVGGVSNARSLARLFAMLACEGELDGARLLAAQRVHSFLEPRPDFDQPDETYGRSFPVGIGGLWIEAPGVTDPSAAPHRVLCHTGAGGAIAWADLDTRLAVAACHNRMFAAVPEPPFATLAQAIRDVAGVSAEGA